jgi:hypothetical protein
MNRIALSKNVELFASKIFELRGHRIMLDRDLAEIYGLSTKRLNEQVKRNLGRFPDDFMFELTKMELNQLVANCDRFNSIKHSTVLPKAFTEHGALMLASVLNSEVAVAASVQVIRAFIHLRSIVTLHKDLADKILDLEEKYDSKFKIVFDALKKLMIPAKEPGKQIGFVVKKPGQ